MKEDAIILDGHKKYIALSFIIVFYLLGLLLYLRGEVLLPEPLSPREEKIQLAGDIVTCRVIGNDFCINKVNIPVCADNLHSDSKLNVMIIRGHNLGDESEVLEKKVVSASDIETEILIQFSDIKLKHNRDYTIVIDGMEFDENEELYLYKNESGDGFACDITYFSRTSKLFFVWKIILVLVPMLFVCCILFGVGVWRALGLEVILDCVILYILALLDCFALILPVFFTLSIVSTVFIIYKLFSDENGLAIQKSNIFEALTFGMIAVILMYVSRFQKVWAWDEMTHWGTVVQGMWMFDKMPQHSRYSGFNFRYPPVYSLYQLLYIELRGKYSEAVLFFAKYLMEAMLSISAFSGLKIKKKTEWFYILVVMMVLILPSFVMGSTSGLPYTLYADIVFGAATGYFFIALTRFICNVGVVESIELAGAVFLLPLIKESGMIVLTAVLIGILTTCVGFKLLKKSARLHMGSTFGIIVSMFVLSKLSWSLFLMSRMKDIEVAVDEQASASGMFSILDLFNFLIGKGKQYQYDLIWIHLKKLFIGKYYVEEWITLSFVAFLFMLVVCFSLGCRILNINDPSKFELFSIGVISTTALLVGYWMVYAFSYTEQEGIALASEDRYLGSWLLGVCLWMLYYVFSNYVGEATYQYRYYLSLMVLGIVLVTGGYKGIKYAQQSSNYLDDGAKKAEVLRNILNESDKLYYVSAGDNGFKYIQYMYYSAPIILNPLMSYDNETGEVMVSYMPRIESPSEYERQLSLDDFVEDIEDYDYLYVETSDARFVDDYGVLFDDEIVDGMLYKINSKGTGVRLVSYQTVYQRRSENK